DGLAPVCARRNLFHILTIGSSKLEHELYGFHRGYFVSPHHVSETIRNFVAYFFSCDVCRTNFLKMYDDCGHEHCSRLQSEITLGLADGSDPARMELALWLWEVHNSVNARLMKEAAQQQNRLVSNDETLASRFPTKKMCPDCWLDQNMTKWDNDRVFRFLEDWYWPEHEASDWQFQSVIAGTVPPEEEPPVQSAKEKPSYAWYRWGMGFASILCLVSFASFVLVATINKHRKRRRKKFVDSRFVKKKQGWQQGWLDCNC
ncbi:hypothetical protein ACHAWF_000613, partial [Thalassiosira exigua]